LAKLCMVNGDDEHAVFKHLKHYKSGLDGVRTIQWNLVKFIVDRTGRVRYRFDPPDAPSLMEPAIKELLAEDTQQLRRARYWEQLTPKVIAKNIQNMVQHASTEAQLATTRYAVRFLKWLQQDPTNRSSQQTKPPKYASKPKN